MISIFGMHHKSSNAQCERCLDIHDMRLILITLVLIAGLLTGCKQREAPEDSAHVPQVQLEPDIVREIAGRWRISRYDGCGVVSMVDGQADPYIGKTAVIEHGRMVLTDAAGQVLTDHLGVLMKGQPGDEFVCRFKSIKVSTQDTVEHLSYLTGCDPGNPIFDSFIEQVNSKTIRVFEPQPDCGATPFTEFFMPNPKTIVARWREVYFFMNREGEAGKAEEAKHSALPANEPG